MEYPLRKHKNPASEDKWISVLDVPSGRGSARHIAGGH